jgi:hypothetical protein
MRSQYQRADTHTVSAADRPTSTAYDRFTWLVKFFADREYDEERIRKIVPSLCRTCCSTRFCAKQIETSRRSRAF